MRLVLVLAFLLGMTAGIATAMITENQAEKIASDATGGSTTGNNDHRYEDGYPYWFVQVEIGQQVVVVKIGANSGKVYGIYEYRSMKPYNPDDN
jgi:uncharacterized membrane protein YkoI